MTGPPPAWASSHARAPATMPSRSGVFAGSTRYEGMTARAASTCASVVWEQLPLRTIPGPAGSAASSAGAVSVLVPYRPSPAAIVPAAPASPAAPVTTGRWALPAARTSRSPPHTASATA